MTLPRQQRVPLLRTPRLMIGMRLATESPPTLAELIHRLRRSVWQCREALTSHLAVAVSQSSSTARSGTATPAVTGPAAPGRTGIRRSHGTRRGTLASTQSLKNLGGVFSGCGTSRSRASRTSPFAESKTRSANFDPTRRCQGPASTWRAGRRAERRGAPRRFPRPGPGRR